MDESDFIKKLGTATIPRDRSVPVKKLRRRRPSESDTELKLDEDGEVVSDRWASRHRTFWGASKTYRELPAGLYKAIATQQGIALQKLLVRTDHLHILPDNACNAILKEFEVFWKKKPEFSKRGFLHKRGYLLWGPPAGGKTSLIQLLIERLINNLNGVVLFVDNPEIASQALQLIRSIEETRPLICVLEDLDALVEQMGEHHFLALLDGEAQIDNVAFLATTNYPERLDKRFMDRPSRFDTIRYIGMPNAASRRVYLRAKEPGLTDKELDLWVEASDGFSIAHLKEMIIAVKCFGQPLERVAKRLQDMRAHQPKSSDDPDRDTAGFVTLVVRDERGGWSETEWTHEEEEEET